MPRPVLVLPDTFAASTSEQTCVAARALLALRRAPRSALFTLALIAIGYLDLRAVHAQTPTPTEPALGGEAQPEAPSAPDDGSASAPTADPDLESARVLQLTLPRGAWRIDAAVASPESSFGGTSLGEPATAPIALDDATLVTSAYPQSAPTPNVLGEVSVGVSQRVDVGVRASMLTSGSAPALFGLASRIRLFASERGSLGMRLQASTFGARSTVGSVGLTWLVLRGHLLAGLMPEFSFRLAVVDGAPLRTTIGAIAPLTLAYAHSRFRVGGHVGAGVMDREGLVAAVVPIGVDGSATLLERKVRLEAWLSFGAAVFVAGRVDVEARGSAGLRISSNH